MRITLSQDEVEKIIVEHINNIIDGGAAQLLWKFSIDSFVEVRLEGDE